MTSRQKKALSALIESPSIKQAAERAGIGYSTVRTWLKEDAVFRAAYQTELAALVESAAAQAKRALSPALSTLREIVEDPEVSTAARISAARALLEYGIRAIEAFDLIPRLEALERGFHEEG